MNPAEDNEPFLTHEHAARIHRTWMTAAEAAAYLNLKPRTILLWARQGRIKGYALTGTQRRVWRFLRTDLDAIVLQKKPVVSSAQPSVLVNERR